MFEFDKYELENSEIKKFSAAIGEACSSMPFGIKRVDWRGIKRRKEILDALRERARTVSLSKRVMRALSQAVSESDTHMDNASSPTRSDASPVRERDESLHPNTGRKRPLSQTETQDWERRQTLKMEGAT